MSVRRRRRGAWLSAWVAVTAIAIIGAFLLGQRLKSPWDQAISNADADRTVFGTVSTREIPVDTLALNGTVTLGTKEDLTPPSEGGLAVVTRTGTAKGDKISPGDFVAEVSGVPVIAIYLPFPLYRDLMPGDSGTDVRALQEFLADRNLLPPASVTGKFGATTSTAVASLYTHVGAVPPSTDQRQREEQPSTGSESAQATEDSLNPRSTGIPLLRASVVVVPKGGALVASASKIGTTIDEATPLLTVRKGAPSVTIGVPADLKPESGQVFAVSSTIDSSSRTTARVTKIGEFTPGGDDATPGYPVQLQLDSVEGLADGDTVIVTPEQAKKGPSGLTVPLTALRDGTDGPYVLKATGTGPSAVIEAVPVRLGTRGGGYVLVTGASLSEGDKVVVSQ